MNIEELIESCGEETDQKRMTMRTLYEEAWKPWLDDYSQNESKESRVIELKRLELTGDDGFFIWSYTGSSSGWLNSDKRNGYDYSSKCKEKFATSLTKALQKINPFLGKVYRWEEADDELKKFNWFKDNIGLNIIVPYFLSTSKDDCTNDPMIWEIETIANGNGRDISAISNALEEQEILFLPNSKFTITGVGKDNRTIYFQELAGEAPTDFELSKIYYHKPEDVDPKMIEPGMFD
ncbi:hypothetical protein [Pedobacter gandavensis]|uniref:hypothetical protein n=1 Tax=Pedobacter gandavensis TaxID=2679963 RepID=UPI002930E060|nr:hypothetical protein [Pedobacter gandavensis]